jgi:hypothetical protein
MANPERGEVDLEVGETRYRLALGMAGLRAIQQAVSTPQKRVTLLDVATGAQQGDVEYLAVLIWGALQRHHPEVPLSGMDAIIDELGGVRALPVLLGKVSELLLATAPDARDAGQLKKTRGPAIVPTTPAAGTTGTASTSKAAKSA